MKYEETSTNSSSNRDLRPGFVPRHEARRHLSQPIRIDTAGAGDVTEGEVKRRKSHMRGEIRVPGGARLGSLDKFLDHRAMVGLITCKGRWEVVGMNLGGTHH